MCYENSVTPLVFHAYYTSMYCRRHLISDTRNEQCVDCGLDPTTLQMPPNGTWLFDPPVAWVQGGVRDFHSKPFLFDSREALAYVASIADTYPPPSVTDRARVTILTDGLCGSTCCQFATMAREANAATFVGVGGLWGEPIDVASYCGGYVSTPEFLLDDAINVNMTSVPVPQFEVRCDARHFVSSRDVCRMLSIIMIININIFLKYKKTRVKLMWLG